MRRGGVVRWGRRAYGVLVVLLLFVALVPQADAPLGTPNDKVNHILAFLTLAIAARLLWPAAHPLVLFLWLALFGGLIEVLQDVMGLGRDGDWVDFVADVGAIVVGLALASAWLRFDQRRRSDI